MINMTQIPLNSWQCCEGGTYTLVGPARNAFSLTRVVEEPQVLHCW